MMKNDRTDGIAQLETQREREYQAYQQVYQLITAPIPLSNLRPVLEQVAAILDSALAK